MRSISKKRRLLLAERKRVREAVLERDKRQCQAKDLVPEVRCWGPLAVHEVKPRGRGGDWLSVDEGITLCAAHHQWVHEHSLKAEELGLLKHSWEK